MKDALATAPRNTPKTPNTPLKEVMAQCEISQAWPEAALKFAQGAGDSPTFLQELARDCVLKKKPAETRVTGDT
ncbi:hypothetical protein [Caenimonas sp. SL110]|uniref:hypothetical protein n=1 Tax=Caenimonas sp. SL110 TaxID=1450524 RepID=UPI0006549779|nr:hypothetical protein [Caenimonas sp. SL110]